MAEADFKPVKPCIKCGASERTKAGNCKACAAIWKRAYRAANPDKIRASNAAYIAANPEKYKERCTAWRVKNRAKASATTAAFYAANSEKERARSAAWAKNNPEARRIKDQNRRARKLAAGGKLSKGLAQMLFKLQRGMCPCCQKPLGEDRNLDHIQPLLLGGSNTDDNMQLLHKSCNSQKCAKHPVDFMQERGFLL